MGDSAAEKIEQACDLLEQVSTSDGDTAESRAVLMALERLHRLHQSVCAQTLADFSGAGGPQELGFRDSTAFLIDVLKMSSGEARGRTRRAELLGSQRTLAGEPLAPVLAHCAREPRAGQISAAHVAVIAKMVDRIPAGLANEPADDERFNTVSELVEAFLVDHARQLNPKQLSQDAEELLEHLDPDGQPRREEEAKRRRELDLHRTSNGGSRVG